MGYVKQALRKKGGPRTGVSATLYRERTYGLTVTPHELAPCPILPNLQCLNSLDSSQYRNISQPARAS